MKPESLFYKVIAALYMLLYYTCTAQWESNLGTNSHKVHILYIVPSDKTEKQNYISGLEAGARHLQGFFYRTLGGITFTLTDPIVTVIRSSKPSDQFYDGRFDLNILEEARLFTGVDTVNDSDNRWLVYIDVDVPCEGVGTGALGFAATFPAWDLQGLGGEPVVDPCTQMPNNSPKCRWVGGIAHELGHTLGLPHPPECDIDDSLPICSEAIMGYGYTTYPYSIYTEADLITLSSQNVLQREDIEPFEGDCNA